MLRDQEKLSIHLDEVGGEDAVRVEVGGDGMQTVFVNVAAQELAAGIADLEFEVSTVVTDVNRNVFETPEEDAVRTLMEVLPDLQGMYINSTTGTLVLEVYSTKPGYTDVVEVSPRPTPSSLPAAEPETLSITEAEQVITELLDLDEVLIEPMDSPNEDALTVRGGSAMSKCTVGFAARGGGFIGFLTADHCKKQPQRAYAGHTATGTSIATGRIASSERRFADIAFYSIGSANSLAAGIWRNGLVQSIKSTGTASVGMTACHQGKTTGYQCGKVISTAYLPTWGGACEPALVCMPTFVRVQAAQAGGDSGGPWHVGTVAVGIHKGGNATGLAVYSKIAYRPMGNLVY